MADANEISPEVQRLIDEARAEGRAQREAELQPVVDDLTAKLRQYRYRFLLENSCKRDYLRLRGYYMQSQ